jgi:hypothetical protein
MPRKKRDTVDAPTRAAAATSTTVDLVFNCFARGIKWGYWLTVNAYTAACRLLGWLHGLGVQ